MDDIAEKTVLAEDAALLAATAAKVRLPVHTLDARMRASPRQRTY
jgi:hypothetical protein